MAVAADDWGLTRSLRVLRIYHAGVVSAWRERERCLISDGADVKLVSARSWNEGGVKVTCVPGNDDFVVPVGTMGRHPSVFLFDPLPIWRLLRRVPFDLIDIHEEPNSLAVAEILLIRFLAGSKAPVTLYSAQNIFKRYPWPFRCLERLALRVAKGVHVCNQAAADIVRKKGFQGLTALVPLGVDAHSFAPAAESSRMTRFLVGYVGRLERRKGVHVLLDAVAGTDSLDVTFVGQGPEEKNLKSRAARLGVNVTFLGPATPEELAGIYPSFAALAVPSVPTSSWEEQFCRVAVEAMATGVPIVASSSGALPEVIAGAGLLVSPGDPDQLRNALLRLKEDPSLREDLASRARKRGESFDWACIATLQRELYKAVLS